MITATRSAIPLLIVAVLSIVGAIVLLLDGIGVPPELWAVAFGALAGGGVATVPHTPAGAIVDTAAGPAPLTAVIPPPPGANV